MDVLQKAALIHTTERTIDFFFIFFFLSSGRKKQRLQNVIWANLVLVKYRENKIKAQLFLMTVMF